MTWRTDYQELLKDYAYPESLAVKKNAMKRLIRKKLGLTYERLDGTSSKVFQSNGTYQTRLLDWRLKNRLVAWKYRLLKPFNALKMVYRRAKCRRLGHLEFPEGTRRYCLCCHKWKIDGVWKP